MPEHVSAPQRRCPTCGAPIRPDDPTVLLRGDAIHEACATTPDVTARVAAEFLRQAAPRAYCSACLAIMLALARDEVQDAILRLRAASDFGVARGVRCAGCRQVRITIGVDRGRG